MAVVRGALSSAPGSWSLGLPHPHTTATLMWKWCRQFLKLTQEDHLCLAKCPSQESTTTFLRCYRHASPYRCAAWHRRIPHPMRHSTTWNNFSNRKLQQWPTTATRFVASDRHPTPRWLRSDGCHRS